MSYVDVIDKVDIPKPDKYYTEPSFEETLGLRVAYRREGSGEAVVFLHGAGYTRRWLPMLSNDGERRRFHRARGPWVRRNAAAGVISRFR